jgi:hypothetical protein
MFAGALARLVDRLYARPPGTTLVQNSSHTPLFRVVVQESLSGGLLSPSPPAEKATRLLGQAPAMRPGISRTALFEFRAVAAKISELFRPLEKPPLAALPLFVGC